MNKEEAINEYNKLSNLIGESIKSNIEEMTYEVTKCFIAPFNFTIFDKQMAEIILRGNESAWLSFNEPYDVFLIIEAESIDSFQTFIPSSNFYSEYSIA